MPVIHSQRTVGVKRAPIIYFNIGWMRKYAGTARNDPTIGSHAYLDNHLHGAESFNFAPAADGLIRGYRPPGDREKTNINRMGASARQDRVEEALVVWLAKEPQSKRTLIVGWYRNATVYREARDGGIRLHGEQIHYTVEAKRTDAKLLPPVARTFEVRSSRLSPGMGFGQKPTWYGNDTIDAKVWAYIQSKGKATISARRPKAKKPPRNLDPELRRKVERAAVNHAKRYYRAEYGRSCVIVSVEAKAKGWDLEVYAKPEPILVEVKGLLKSDLVCELTPNEFQKMRARENRRRYVIYVVNNALAEPPGEPIASIFEHVTGNIWRTADGRDLLIKPKTGAVISCR